MVVGGGGAWMALQLLLPPFASYAGSLLLLVNPPLRGFLVLDSV